MGEDVPLDRQDGGEVGEQEEGGEGCQGDSKEGQEPGDYCTQIHQEVFRGSGEQKEGEQARQRNSQEGQKAAATLHTVESGDLEVVMRSGNQMAKFFLQ